MNKMLKIILYGLFAITGILTIGATVGAILYNINTVYVVIIFSVVCSLLGLLACIDTILNAFKHITYYTEVDDEHDQCSDT